VRTFRSACPGRPEGLHYEHRFGSPRQAPPYGWAAALYL